MSVVSAEDFEDAVLMVSEAGTEDEAWVSLDTGAVHIRSAEMGELPGPLPVDIGTSERYVPVPSMKELDLGIQLVFDFVDATMPDDEERVRQMFKRPGAYGRFSKLVAERDLRDRWHDFREAQTRAALAAWCAEHGLQLG